MMANCEIHCNNATFDYFSKNIYQTLLANKENNRNVGFISGLLFLKKIKSSSANVKWHLQKKMITIIEILEIWSACECVTLQLILF